MNLQDLLMQWPLTPQYTQNPIFPDLVSAMIVALIIAVAMNFAFALLRKKTTDIEKMNRVMRETTEWRRQYTDAIKKQDKARIEELKKKQAYVNKMALEMQQQQMRPMLIYMVPSFIIWIVAFPAIFGGTVALSPIEIPWIMCNQGNVDTDSQPRTNEDDTPVPPNANGEPVLTGPCRVPGHVYLWGWFLLTSFGFSGIIAKLTKTSMPSMT
ncbi:MAG TPA: EMC3/TMCO1 family protein [Nitrososphaera sp.]|nr:EMC3/TMCO1 family protein [Nitrososphaera sp.]